MQPNRAVSASSAAASTQDSLHFAAAIAAAVATV